MYAGAMTEAMPMPMPAMMRHSTRSQTPNAMPDRIEETKNRTAPRNITRVRPQRSASLPPSQAPKAQPSRAMATTSPVTAVDLELALDRVDGAVDDRAVEAEEEATDRRRDVPAK